MFMHWYKNQPVKLTCKWKTVPFSKNKWDSVYKKQPVLKLNEISKLNIPQQKLPAKITKYINGVIINYSLKVF